MEGKEVDETDKDKGREIIGKERKVKRRKRKGRNREVR